MTTLPSFLKAGEAKVASQDAAQLANAARKAQAALEWTMAASLWNQAAESLQRDPHTGHETLQAKAHRRSAQTCQAMARMDPEPASLPGPIQTAEGMPGYQCHARVNGWR